MRGCVRIDASVEDTEHAWTIISWSPVLLEGAAYEAFNVLHKQRIGHLKDVSAGTRNMEKAIDVVDVFITPHHRGVVGTLVDENAEDRHKSSGRLNSPKAPLTVAEVSIAPRASNRKRTPRQSKRRRAKARPSASEEKSPRGVLWTGNGAIPAMTSTM